jgi:hypothetical protein
MVCQILLGLRVKVSGLRTQATQVAGIKSHKILELVLSRVLALAFSDLCFTYDMHTSHGVADADGPGTSNGGGGPRRAVRPRAPRNVEGQERPWTEQRGSPSRDARRRTRRRRGTSRGEQAARDLNHRG